MGITTMSEGASSSAYFLLSSALAIVWAVLYGARQDLRGQMLRISLGTMPLGLTEPLFVPAYWNPPTLFDLARRTGFDLESLLFSFAIGGIVFAAYDAVSGTAPIEAMDGERQAPRHRYHLPAVLAAPVVFLALLATTSLNPIYAAALGLMVGFLATLYCRPDLRTKMLVSGALFLILYFVVFAVLNLVFPRYVPKVWNLRALTGVRIVGVPLEELMFAFTFGLYWSSVYEHLAWRSRAVKHRVACDQPSSGSGRA
jgi:hypothetical protein